MSNPICGTLGAMAIDEQEPGTRLTAKGRATRARILDTAADLILERGVAGTGIDDVRKAAGVSGSQMTHYFRDKRHLVKDVIAWQAQSVLSQHRARELGELDSFAAFEQWRNLLVDLQEQRHCEGGCPIGSIAAEIAAGHGGTISVEKAPEGGLLIRYRLPVAGETT